jgi:cytochrome c553
MANQRRKYSPAEELAFTTEVDGHCPLCDAPLFYSKTTRKFKDFDLAHIYPLNPTPAETSLLTDVERLNNDSNHPDNIIALCTRCHGRFDKPRTVEEYNRLASLKRLYTARTAQRILNQQYPLEDDIQALIQRLHTTAPEVADDSSLVLDAKTLDEKLDESLPRPTQRKIRNAVADYYHYIQSAFQEIERADPNAAELILAQVRAYYLKQRELGHDPATIFANVVQWLTTTTTPSRTDAAEALASFFVQNCEVFE